MEQAIFYHAGCSVCLSAEQELLQLVDKAKVNVEVVHLANQRDRIDAAAHAGVQSVPALVLANGQVLHINFGASLADVRG